MPSVIPPVLTDYPNKNSFPFYIIKKVNNNVPPHRHDFLELCLVVEGRGTEIVNGVSHTLEPGTMTFLLPYQIHEIHADPGCQLLLYVCNFDMGLLLNAPDRELGHGLLHEDEAEPAPFVQVSPEQYREMLSLFDRMQLEYSRDEQWRQLILTSMLFEALARFDRVRNQQERSLYAASRREPDSSTIWEIVHYIHQRYQESLTLADLANRFHFSVPNLSKLLKRHLGTSFIDFIHELRIRQACSLLKSSDMAITDIALEVGFRSFASFSRVFNHLKGVSPSAYRKKMSGRQPDAE
ncbi:helix-turn-helix domain-containing protein [Paenibacillus mesophilus]|uniref:helix-turn-helix domain-containing protein n=1 Tax=Paenibacillus mesophilus TaxID=2582849 RepID=UPI0013052F46|nr:AraC family transcriptional regulator [Paenibacillus mesophilus]